MCQYLRNVSMSAFVFLPAGLVLSAALVAGCDSTADPESPAAKAQAEATRAQIRKADEAANEQDKKKGGNNPGTALNIKGRLGGAAPAEDAKPSQ
jgi:hypothetical protein